VAIPALLALAGCADMQAVSGGSVKGSAVPLAPGHESPAAHLHSKITLIERDPCFTGGPGADAGHCTGRYIGEVGGVAQEALNETAHAPQATDVQQASRALQKASGAFQTCDRTGTQCASKLATVNDRLRALGLALDGPAQPSGSTPPSHG
jgi:hypothetical protein